MRNMIKEIQYGIEVYLSLIYIKEIKE